ncbi:drug/metabolite transporter (DMT)-like permease [Paenibacillus sp. V4I3]|uniref:DMT family transporter n=1 Tax=unclassified Paenibacillus TaxID=185978 RepID=UPI00277FBFF3|nr:MULTISPECIES: EamA family transporter [unclassified Paenibacillus]MDQ0875678.1 drug/metabolite transporter (DMT)-like permease [Paenibacillus sp. V4I3]MDQ0888252.1 drug/metabolite transporter (DMT)-like permease [Paenibacillus sp. V4I9]
MIIFNYLLVCLIFGTTFLAIKVGVDASTPPFFSAGIRFFVAGLILFFWMVWKKKANLSLLIHKEMLLTGIGLTFGTFSTLYWAEQYVSSGFAAVLSATAPMMMLVLQTLVLRQKTTSRSAFGCILGFVGIVLLLLPHLTITANIRWIIGCVAILVGQIFYSSGALYSKRVIQRFPQASPIALNAAQMIYGGLLLLILSLFTENVDINSLLSARAIGSLLYLIVIGSMVGHSLFYWLVAKTNPVFPTTWLYVSPTIALTFGVLLYGETITWVSAIGVITIITGTVFANLDSLKQLIHKRRTDSIPVRQAKVLD